jgi:signal transduction histidine kinase
MSDALARISPEQRTLEPALLNQAFERFREASERLESRYAQLLQETEELRIQLRLKEETIRRSEKLATLGQMAAALAHEVRNPLGAMRLFVSLLKRDVADRPGAHKLTQQIDTSIDNLDHVVSNMLHFAKGHCESPSPCNLQSIVLEVVEQSRAIAQPHVEIQFSSCGSSFLLGNQVRLRQAVLNLMQNAKEAVGQSGKIEVRLLGTDPEHIRLEIQDSGPGVPETMMERLFEPFQTSKNEGTGLGLAVVKAVCEEHGAKIEVQNTPGALFRLSFPRK